MNLHIALGLISENEVGLRSGDRFAEVTDNKARLPYRHTHPMKEDVKKKRFSPPL
jgi:hypothetical protein